MCTKQPLKQGHLFNQQDFPRVSVIERFYCNMQFTAGSYSQMGVVLNGMELALQPVVLLYTTNNICDFLSTAGPQMFHFRKCCW